MVKIQVWAMSMIKGFNKATFALIVVILFISSIGNSQNLDSLKNFVNTYEQKSVAKSDTQLTNAYYQIVSTYFDQLNLDSAYKYLVPFAEEANRIRSEKYTAEAQLFFISYFTNKGRLDTAITIAESMLEKPIAEKTIGIALDNLAVAYYYKREPLKALDYFLQALAIFEKVAPLETAYSYSNIANLYSSLGDYDKAIEYFRKCYNVEKQANDPIDAYVGYINFHNTFFSAENFDSSDFYLEKALAARKNIDVDFYDAILLTHKALQEARLGNLNSAIENLESSRSIAKSKGDNFHYALATSHLSGNLINRGEFAKARKMALEVLPITEKNGYLSIRKVIFKNLSTIEEKEGNFQKALKYHQQFKTISDSIFNKQNSKSIEHLKYEREKIEKEKANADTQIVQKQKELVEQELSAQTKINWVIGISAVILLILLFLVSRLNKRNKQNLEKLKESQELIKSKSIELESYNTRLVELNKIKNKLVSLLAHDLRSPLVGIVFSINLIQEEAFSKEEVDEMLKEISASASANLDGLDNLVSWAKTQMEGIERNMVETTTEEIFIELKRELKGLLKTKKITLRFAKTGKDNIIVDFEMLKSSVRNLITNAIKFSDEGQEVSVTSEEKGEEVVIKVADRAGGIPKEMHKTIFEGPITSSPGTKGEKGSGIGLMLAKEFIQINGGSISFETEEGVGTTFIVRLKKPLEV